MERDVMTDRRAGVAGRSAAALLACISLCAASSARAAGFELTAPGSRAVGRAGAVVVGGDDALSVFVNPATILANQARLDAALSVDVHLNDSCMTRVEVDEGAMGQRSAGATLPKVCDHGGPSLIPELANTIRIGERWAISIGVYAPPAASTSDKFGNPKTGTLDGKTGEDRPDKRTPTRYLMMDQKSFQLFPTLGLAYEPLSKLRLGASFGWGISKIDFTNAVYSPALILGSTLATSDISNHLTGFDGFVPRVQVGAWTKPLDDVPLEFGASFTWTQDIQVSNASLKLRGLNTDISPPSYAQISDKPQIRGDFKHVDVTVPQLSQLNLGTRYAKPLAHAVDKVGDRLSRERFDVEFNSLISFGKHFDAIRVNPPAGAQLQVPSPPPGVIPPFAVPLPQHIALQHHWTTQYSLRLGGDYNPLPGRLGLRAGVSYDSSGVANGYQNIDFTPFQNVGLHVGATLRLAGKFDISAAFAHYFFPDVKVSVHAANVRRIVNPSGQTLQPGDDAVVNAGTFARGSTVLSMQLGAHF
jgi:long-subunit fatty acid transport protein